MSFGGAPTPAPMIVPPAPTPPPMMTPATQKPPRKPMSPSMISAALTPQAGQTGSKSLIGGGAT